MDILLSLFFVCFLILQNSYIAYKIDKYYEKIYDLNRPLNRSIQLLNRFKRRTFEKQCKFNTIFFFISAIILYFCNGINKYDFHVVISLCMGFSFAMFMGYIACKLIRYFKNKQLKSLRKKWRKNK